MLAPLPVRKGERAALRPAGGGSQSAGFGPTRQFGRAEAALPPLQPPAQGAAGFGGLAGTAAFSAVFQAVFNATDIQNIFAAPARPMPLGRQAQPLILA